MHSLILSLILACSDAEVDQEQLAKEQAQKELEKQRKKRMFQLQKSIYHGGTDKSFSQGLRLYKETSEKKILSLLKQAARQAQDPVAELENLKKSKLPDDVAEEIQFWLLLQKPDKQEAATFASAISDEDRKAAFLIEAMQAGAIIDSQIPLVQAASSVLKKADTSLLEGLPELTTAHGMLAFTKLALEGNSEQVSKYAQSLQTQKDPLYQFYGLMAENKKQEALVLAFEKNIFIDGSAFIQTLGAHTETWNMLLKVKDPAQVLQKGTWELLPYAKAAMKVGAYSVAQKMFTAARKDKKSISQDFSEEELFQHGMASFFLRDVSALEVLSKEDGPHKSVFNGLFQLSQGKPFPLSVFENMSTKDRLSLVVHTASNDAQVAEQMLPQAIIDADTLGDANLRIVTRLQHEAFLRTYKGESTIEMLDAMKEELGAEYPNLRTEISVRKHLQGVQESLELAEDASISERAWQSYLAGAIPSSMEPIPLMLSAMQILKQRKGYEKFINIMWQKTPVHRMGPLSTGTVLDLSHGLLFDDAVTKFVGTSKLEEVAQSLIFQDLARRGEIIRKESYHSRNPLLGMELENRNVLLDAASQVRIQMQNFWTGGDFPQQAIDRLHQVEARLVMDDEEASVQKQKREEKKKEAELQVKAEEKAAKEVKPPKSDASEKKEDAQKEDKEQAAEEKKDEDAKPKKKDKPKKKEVKSPKTHFEQQFDSLREDFSYRTLVLKSRMDLNFLQSNFRKIVFLSYRVHNGSLIGVAFSDSSGQVLNLGSAEEIFALSAQQKSLLLQDRENPAVLAPDSENHKVANRLKNLIFEPFNDTTQRLVSMIFIAPPELEQMTFGTLPDQQNGLRFLSGMRRVSSVPGLSELLRSSKLRSKKLERLAVAEEVENSTESDLLRSGKENQPVEVDQISLSFKSDDRKVLIGEKSSLKEYREHAPMARFIFFAQAKSSDAGGFLLNGEELTLSEMSSMTLKAKLVVISAHPDAQVQRRRVHALLNAGARNILVFDWSLPNNFKRAMLDKMFESLLRDEPIAEAIAKISKLSLGIPNKNGVKANGPGSWGSLHLYGYPDRIGN